MEQENLQQAEELNNNETISPDTLNDETQNEVSVQGQPTPIEKAPEKEVPAWDFSSFNTDEIISHMKSLIDDFPVQRLKVLDSLPQVFEAQYQREYDKALADFTKDGSPAEAFDYQDTSKERFYSVYRTYREKKTEYYKKLEGEKDYRGVEGSDSTRRVVEQNVPRFQKSARQMEKHRYGSASSSW